MNTINRREFLTDLGAGAALAALPRQLFAADPAKRPNILLITADDLGNTLGCYGDKTVPTPHLDALAARGTRFTEHHVVQASCSPSRSGLLTGLYPHQNGMLGLSHLGFQLTRDWPTLPGLLKKAGYRTGIIGKLHVEGPKPLPFDYRRGGPGRTRSVKSVEQDVTGFFNAARGQPWCLQVDMLDPHNPWMPQVEGLPATALKPGDVPEFSWTGTRTWIDPNPEVRAHDNIANYYNCVARLDAIVGRILERLQRTGQTDNTLVIFWSDNGPSFPRGKTTLFTAGTRTPLIVAGPGIPAGQARPELVSTVDIFPTLLTATGVALPRPQALPSGQPCRYDGRALQPLLAGKEVEWRSLLFTEHTFHTPWAYSPLRSVTDGRWRLIRELGATPAGDKVTLYDRQADPDERRDVTAAHPAERDRLDAALTKWRTETHDPLLDQELSARLATIPGNLKQPVPPYFVGTSRTGDK